MPCTTGFVGSLASEVVNRLRRMLPFLIGSGWGCFRSGLWQ